MLCIDATDGAPTPTTTMPTVNTPIAKSTTHDSHIVEAFNIERH